MINNYPKAYVEVLEILKYIPAEEKKKIPYDIIETLKNKADLNYVFKIDFNPRNCIDDPDDTSFGL